MSKKDALGRWGEEYAARYLQGCGYTLLRRNWKSAAAEVDLVAQDGAVFVLCEVKTRKSHSHGHPSEAVDARRQARLSQAAELFLIDHPGSSARIDVISITTALTGITLEHLKSVIA